MCIKEAQEHLGRFLKRFALKYKSKIAVNESSLSQSKDGKTYFYFGVFPVIMIAVGLVTSFDIHFYWKYHYTSSKSDKKFLYLFPIPCVAPSFFVVNFIMSVATTIKLFCWDKMKKYWGGLNDGATTPLPNIAERRHNIQDTLETQSNEQNTLETRSSEQNRSSERQSREEDTPRRQEEKAMELRKKKVKQHCECILTMVTLFSLFGIVYLFYHGLWIIIALLVYPGRILFGSMFIIPLILAIIPTWITAIKMAENLFDACNESSSCINCCRNYCNCCIICCTSIYDCCIRCWEVICKYCICCIGKICLYMCCTNSNSCHRCCAWLALLVYELVFWGLFIVILFYTSRFLLGSIDSKNEMVKLVLSYLIISVTSLILVWFNTDLVIYSKDKKEIPGGQQQNNQDIPGGQQQNNQEIPGGQQRNNQEIPGGQQQNNQEIPGGQQQNNQ